MLVFVYSSIEVSDAFPQVEEEQLRSVLREALLKEGGGGGVSFWGEYTGKIERDSHKHPYISEVSLNTK